ncbi:transporter, MscS family [Synechococcus sp. PCC 7335]|uniref:mechanosensitive ion channel family protein n=1 Tax=Synechococcus sp. (strain ATCC 29403 / PCC 7335) TaxID=91464 RepID=UPI00017EC36E|nr:mechanosensitive ion channel family protein [Synechococcus sp. PCC 7335]EDX85451.1 transporter, MscS family [Synechococcus sp. PCC 7335]
MKKTVRKVRFGVCLAALTIALSVAPVWAQDEGIQEGSIEEMLPVEIETDQTEAAVPPDDGVYFADVMVRGQSVFQVGSLEGVSASQRAAGISRRIASLLDRTQGAVVVTAAPADIADVINIEANGRILMTVTEQDAQDLRLPLDVVVEDWTDELERSFDKPPVAIDVVQRLNATVRQLSRDAINSIPALIGVLIVIFFTWLIAKGVRFSAFQWAQRTEGDRSTEILIGRLGYGAVWVAGAVVALGVWGIDFATMLSALGLTSVAIGFSLKDVLSNYISGVILLAARPFHIGDQVVIDGYEGTITQVQLRSTTIKTYNGRMIYIPNQEVFSASITNNTASKYLRSSVFVGIDYEADIIEAREVIVRAISTLDKVQPEPIPEVLVSELAASTVNLEVRFWVDSRRAGFLETTSIVAQKVKEALQEYDIEMPTEIYTLLLKDVPEELKQGNGSIVSSNDGISQRATISEAQENPDSRT